MLSTNANLACVCPVDAEDDPGNLGSSGTDQASKSEDLAPSNLEADILKYLKDSFAYVHKALDTINDKNLVEPVRSPFGEGSVSRLGLATTVSWHGFDHYGQMVVYLRMNGIVPPASR